MQDNVEKKKFYVVDTGSVAMLLPPTRKDDDVNVKELKLLYPPQSGKLMTM